MANTSIDDAPSSLRSGRLPNFLLIGAMKSGTTSLARYLRVHPDVFMTRKKEVHFFDYRFDMGIDWYASWFEEASTERIRGEASPSYMYLEQAVDRMASTVPRAKLVAILRNPVDRAYSQYWRNRLRGLETLEFVDALAAESERLSDGDLTIRLRSAYLDRGRYLRQIECVWKRYPRDAVHIVLFEEMTAQLRETYAEVCRFLGIDPFFAPPGLGAGSGQSQSKRVRSIRLQKIAHRFGHKVEKRVWKLNRVPWKYPPMDPNLRAELMERFADDNAALSVALGKDLASLWK